MRDETIWDVLNRDLFFVKNAVKITEPKFCDKLDVYDPVQRVVTMQVREPDLSSLTKAARFCGGNHDRGAAFDLVAHFQHSDQQTVRVSGRTPMFGLNGRRFDITDHRGALIGTLKKLVWTVGLKFEFIDLSTREKVILEIQPTFFWREIDIFLNATKIASVKRNWQESHDDFFRAEGFDFAFWISPEVSRNSCLRQALVALGFAHHRVAM